METLIKIALILHIIAGNLALISGAISMIVKKGSKPHKRFGRIFFYAMMVISATALFLSIAKNSEFLFYIGIFVFYQTYSGFKAVKNKSLRHNWLDGIIIFVALINGIAMIASGATVLMVFGGITFLLMFTEWQTFSAYRKGKEIPRLTWLAKHIGMMTGSYIGTFTAFLVVNIQFEPGWVIWLAPTVVFVPLMQYWTWKFTKKPLKRVTSK